MDIGIFYVVVWVGLSIGAGVYASNKGRSGIGVFLLSILLSPLLGLVVAKIMRPDVAYLEQRQIDAGAARRCPDCDELVRTEARKCKHCGRDLPAAPAAA